MNTTFHLESLGSSTEKNFWGRNEKKIQGMRYTEYMELVVTVMKHSRDPPQVSDSGEQLTFVKFTYGSLV